MLALSLTLALLQASRYSSMQATPADSAFAIAALDSAAVAMTSAGPGLVDFELRRRLGRQLQVWGDQETTWRVAWATDSVAADRRQWFYILTSDFLIELLRLEKYAAFEGYLMRLPPAARSRVLAGLPNSMGNFPPEVADVVLPLAESAPARASLTAARARMYLMRADTASYRDTLAYALRMILDDTTAFLQAQGLMHQLLASGGEIPVEDLVTFFDRNQRIPGPDSLWFARVHVASLLASHDRATAVALADTLLRNVTSDAAPARLELAKLLDIRAAPGDSSHAAAIRDSVLQSSPAVRGPDLGRELWAAANERDSVSFVNLMVQLRGQDAAAAAIRRAVEIAAAKARTRDFLAPALPPEAPRSWSRFVFQRAWPASGTLDPAARDSVRVSLVSLLAVLDPVAALDSATSGVQVQPYADLARAEAIRSLAGIDAERAAVAARSLRDEGARNVAYLELTRRAIAGGRLADATTFADATVGGESRVDAQFSLARALGGAGLRAQATERAREALAHLEPLPACSGMCTAVGRSPARMDPRLIANVARFAMELDLSDDLARWAASRSEMQSRAAAWLVIAEALAELRLGLPIWFPVY